MLIYMAVISEQILCTFWSDGDTPLPKRFSYTVQYVEKLCAACTHTHALRHKLSISTHNLPKYIYHTERLKKIENLNMMHIYGPETSGAHTVILF